MKLINLKEWIEKIMINDFFEKENKTYEIIPNNVMINTEFMFCDVHYITTDIIGIPNTVIFRNENNFEIGTCLLNMINIIEIA